MSEKQQKNKKKAEKQHFKVNLLPGQNESGDHI